MSIKWTKNLLFAFSFLGLFAVNAQNIVIDEVIAVVGRNAIFRSDFDQQILQFQTQGLEVDEKMKTQILEDILLQKLLIHKADVDSIEVSEYEIDGEVESRLNYFRQQVGSDEALEAYFKKSIAEIKEEMKAPLEEQIKSQRARWAVMEGVAITPAEINRFFYSIPKDSLPMVNDQIQIGQILRFPPPNKEAVDATKQKLLDLKERVQNGESFETLAILYSEDPGSSRNGGLYEGITRGMFVKEFESVMYSLKVNEISDVFKTEYGYHIVQLMARNGETVDVRHILISPKIGADELVETRGFLDSLRNMILDEDLTFDAAAKKFSDDKDTKNNGGLLINKQLGNTYFELEKMDRTLSTAIEGLAVDEISEPLYVKTQDGKEAYRLLYIKDKRDKHLANLKDDYQRVQAMALRDKETKVMDDWASDMIKRTYVHINDEFLQMKFKNNWTKK
jgi:peptidyl-prolyl cis-trans isomerase SurA